jgi:ankyrin repeat protein
MISVRALQGLLGPVAQVQVNRLETSNRRSALMQCAFDPQSNSTLALDKNCTTIAKRLVSAGANVSLVDKHGWNVIAMGAMKGFTGYIKYLLSKGADIDNQDKSGRTPLMKAVTHGHVVTALLLLEQGADVSLVDIHGWSVLHFSTRQLRGNRPPRHYLDLFFMLVQIDSPALSVRPLFLSPLPSPPATVPSADKEASEDTSKKHQERKTKKELKKLPIDAQDSDGRTALMYASLVDGSGEVMGALLNAGADPTLEDMQGLTAYGLSISEASKVRLAMASAAWASSQHAEWLQHREARNPHLNQDTCAKH